MFLLTEEGKGIARRTVVDVAWLLLSHLSLVELAVVNVAVPERGHAAALHDIVHPVPIVRRLVPGLVRRDLFSLALPPGARGGGGGSR